MSKHRRLGPIERARVFLRCYLTGHVWAHNGPGSWSVHCTRPGCIERFQIPAMFAPERR